MPRYARWTLWIALVALLGASVGGNIWLYRLSDQYYRELNGLRLDPIGLAAYPSAPPEAQPEGPVLFFGDSRAAEWPAPADLPEVTFLNRGIGSQTSIQVLGRFDAHVAPLRPSAIVLQVGVNDLKTIAIFPERTEQIVADCIEHIAQIVARARAIHAKVIITSIMPVGRVPIERRMYWTDAATAAIVQVNRALEQLAASDVIFLDTAAILADPSGQLRDDYRRDFLHLNAAGYQALNQALSGRIRELGL